MISLTCPHAVLALSPASGLPPLFVTLSLPLGAVRIEAALGSTGLGVHQSGVTSEPEQRGRAGERGQGAAEATHAKVACNPPHEHGQCGAPTSLHFYSPQKAPSKSMGWSVILNRPGTPSGPLSKAASRTLQASGQFSVKAGENGEMGVHGEVYVFCHMCPGAC